MKILVPVFDLIADEPTILFAGMIARSTKASIRLFHVAPKKMEKQASRDYGQVLLAHVLELLPDVAVEIKVRRGNPNKKTLSEAQEGLYDFLIVPTWQLHRHLHALPIAASKSQEIPCCVIVVRNPRVTTKRILICSGGVDISNSVIDTGAKMARVLGAEVTLLHVVGFVPSMYTGLFTIEETVDDLMQTDTPIAQHLRKAAKILSKQNVDAEIKIRRGSTTAEIVREVDIEDYDLVVIGASGGAGWMRGWFMGNLTKDVINSVALPVMIVNQARASKSFLSQD
jgi:nucleotide-binding universal stress UspA family protein